MNYRYIIYEKDGNIARIILNKPEKLNCMSFLGPGEDFAEVLDAITRAEEDDDVKVVILKGKGRAFCTGHDLSKVGFLYGFGTGKPGERRPSQRIRLYKDRAGNAEGYKKILLCTKLTIAQLHGYALEGGMIMALGCDFIIASEDCRIGFPGQRLGFAGSGEHTLYQLMLTIGMKRAIDFYITGREVSGKEAEQMGLITKAVPADKLEEYVENLARALCFYPRDGIAIGKATQHMFYDLIGLISSYTIGYVSHTLFTNLRFEPDEFNFFKERRDAGAKAAFKKRDLIFNKLMAGK